MMTHAKNHNSTPWRQIIKVKYNQNKLSELIKWITQFKCSHMDVYVHTTNSLEQTNIPNLSNILTISNDF